MLYIRFGTTPETVWGIDRHFRNVYEREWFNDPLVREMVKDVDKSEVIAGTAIDSPLFGVISPLELSGGVKTLICMLKEPGKEFYGTSCGNNCGKWMIEIGKRMDVHIALMHILEFLPPSQATDPILNAVCVNTGAPINTMQDLIHQYARCDEMGVFRGC